MASGAGMSNSGPELGSGLARNLAARIKGKRRNA